MLSEDVHASYLLIVYAEYVRLVPGFRISDAVPLLPVPPWRGQGQSYFTHINFNIANARIVEAGATLPSLILEF
jgi:hypothetical protein